MWWLLYEPEMRRLLRNQQDFGHNPPIPGIGGTRIDSSGQVFVRARPEGPKARLNNVEGNVAGKGRQYGRQQVLDHKKRSAFIRKRNGMHVFQAGNYAVPGVAQCSRRPGKLPGPG